jgi:hypothetical protein
VKGGCPIASIAAARRWQERNIDPAQRHAAKGGDADLRRRKLQLAVAQAERQAGLEIARSRRLPTSVVRRRASGSSSHSISIGFRIA